jgi:hypothetical protein
MNGKEHADSISIPVLYLIYHFIITVRYRFRSANIQQQIVEGITKSLEYVPGQNENNDGITRKSWNVFRANGRWHIVDVINGMFSAVFKRR